MESTCHCSNMGALRIVSFLPTATEMIYLLGLEDRLVGQQLSRGA
jgi:ABC-type hemin transport system substrate-binding protein